MGMTIRLDKDDEQKVKDLKQVFKVNTKSKVMKIALRKAHSLFCGGRS